MNIKNVNLKLYISLLLLHLPFLYYLFLYHPENEISAIIGSIFFIFAVLLALTCGYVGAISSIMLSLIGLANIYPYYMKTGHIHYFYSISYILSTILTVIIIGYFVEANHSLKESLLQEAHTDHLTKLNNFNTFDDTISYHINKSQQENSNLGLIVLDIDDFKKINDACGHQTGDKILRDVAKVIVNSTREDDVLFRFGGDEFVIIIPNSSKDIADSIFERLQSNCQNIKTHITYNLPFPISFSAGYSEYPVNGDNGKSLLHAADLSMYEIKKTTKNALKFAK